MEGARILVVDDDRAILATIADFLSDYDFIVSTATDGKTMFEVLEHGAIDLIVLDLRLPDIDGLALVGRLRQSRSVPVIMLTSLGSDVDRIVGLEMGADDYLAKPFNPRELLARIKAVLRRAQHRPLAEPAVETTPSGHRMARFAGWTLDLDSRELRAVTGQRVDLTSGEFNLLEALVQTPQRVLSRDRLLDMTHSHDTDVFDRTIDVLILRLRRKIEPDPRQPALIRTERNAGYIFTPRVEWR